MGFADISFDEQRQKAHIGDVLIPTTGTEFLILKHLAERADTAVTYRELAQAVFGSVNSASHNLESHVSRLRRKVAQVDGHRERITTCRGLGYRYNTQPPDAPIIVAVTHHDADGNLLWLATGREVNTQPDPSLPFTLTGAQNTFIQQVVAQDGSPAGSIVIWRGNTR